MSIDDAVQAVRRYFKHQPPDQAVKATAAEFLTSVCERGPSIPRRIGTNVYSRDWELLVVLDTCRTDALQTVADEYEFLPTEIPTTLSVGSKTKEWMENTFTPQWRDETKQTAYITFNPNSRQKLDSDWFSRLEEVWRTDWNEELGGVQPRAVTDRTITADRESDPERLIAHYKQPHAPYADFDAIDPTNPMEERTYGVFHALENNTVDVDAAWEAYLDELRRGLDDVAVLLSAVDADRVAITADHGECFGDWGIYGHPGGVPVPELIRVPWVVTTAERTADYDPTDSGRTDDQSVTEKLEALGYK